MEPSRSPLWDLPSRGWLVSFWGNDDISREGHVLTATKNAIRIAWNEGGQETLMKPALHHWSGGLWCEKQSALFVFEQYPLICKCHE